MTREELAALYDRIRGATGTLVAPLTVEDQVVQTMPDVSPVKWHLSHTSWFFETFVLRGLDPARRPLRDGWHDLFNSYYKGVGEPFPRARRGTLSRPTVADVRAYRGDVDGAMRELFASAPEAAFEHIRFLIELGLHHEEQHQELIVTDVKHILWSNPSRPPYRPGPGEVENPWAPLPEATAPMGAGGESGPGSEGAGAAWPGGTEAAPHPPRWVAFEGGVREIGAGGPEFQFDNERPRHRVHLDPWLLADRLVTCGEYLAFMADGGYGRPELWLSDGWDCRLAEGWEAPLYWERADRRWTIYTLGGRRGIAPAEPVCHVSYYEADAFARWARARLPLEAEWETAAAERPSAPGELLESGRLHPAPARDAAGQPLRQMTGDCWEWTASAYTPYPGFRPFGGAVGEYNGKFMANQLVLRGGSCATPARHIRPTYRNFFAPHVRWQFAGIRLAR